MECNSTQPTYKTVLELMLSTTPHTRDGHTHHRYMSIRKCSLASWFCEINSRSIVWQSMRRVSGADISENSIHHYLPEWANSGQKSGQNIMKAWPERKINVILELSTLENPYVDTLFDLIYIFKIFFYFEVNCLISPNLRVCSQRDSLRELHPP